MKRLNLCLIPLLAALAAPAGAQDSEDSGDDRGTRLQRRIEDLRARGIEDSDPRMQKLLRFQEMLGQRRDAAGGRRARGRSQDLDRLKEFVTAQNLQSLFDTLPDGTPATPEQYDRNIGRHRRQLDDIMASFDRGQSARGQKMIESARLEFEIAKLAQRYSAAADASADRLAIRQEIETLLRRQVRIDLDVRELKLQELAERLERQKEELRKDRDRVDDIASKKLDRHVTRAEGRSARSAVDEDLSPEDASDSAPGSTLKLRPRDRAPGDEEGAPEDEEER